MAREVIRCLDPRPGHIVADATLGGGGHAAALLARVQPGGRLIGLDLDRPELDRTVARLRVAGYSGRQLAAHHASFVDLSRVLAVEGVATVDALLVDLGASSMQQDDAARGFHYKTVGPLDLRFDASVGEPAAALLERLDADALARVLETNADEPHATLIARLLKDARVTTTHALERVVRTGLHAALPDLGNATVKMSVRRTLQALRIAVNDELTALDRLLEALPSRLAPGARVAILTFHSGEDRRVKKAFRAGQRAGVYSSIAREAIRSTKEETYADRRAGAAKLRWAIRARR